jgi:hypothetical protein
MFFKLRILGSSNRLFIPYHKGRKWGRIFRSKMPRCKTPEILRSEAYLNVRCNDEG